MRISFSTFGRLISVRLIRCTCWSTFGWIARPASSGFSSDSVST